MSLTPDDIRKAKITDVVKAEVPEWNGDVYITAFSLRARNEVAAICAAAGSNEPENVIGEVLVRCLCNEKGELLYTFTGAERLTQLSHAASELAEQDSRVLDRLFEVAQKHNGLTGSADDAGNSPGSQGSDSSTD